MHDTLDYFARTPEWRGTHRHRITFRGDLPALRALGPAALARRGGAPQALTAGQDARRPGAALRQPPLAARQPGRAAGQEAPLHGHRAGAGRRVEPRPRAAMAAAAEGTRCAAGLARCMADLGALYRASPALWEADEDPSGFAWIDIGDARRHDLRLAPSRRARRAAARTCWSWSRTWARRRAAATGSASRSGAAGAPRSTPMTADTAARARRGASRSWPPRYRWAACRHRRWSAFRRWGPSSFAPRRASAAAGRVPGSRPGWPRTDRSAAPRSCTGRPSDQFGALRRHGPGQVHPLLDAPAHPRAWR